MEAAGNLSVSVVGRIYDRQNSLVGFAMPRLRAIEPAKLTSTEKMKIFTQIRRTIPELHNRQIIHGDIKTLKYINKQYNHQILPLRNLDIDIRNQISDSHFHWIIFLL